MRPPARRRFQASWNDSPSRMAGGVFRRFARPTLVEGAIPDACPQTKNGQLCRRLSKRRTHVRCARGCEATLRKGQRHALASPQRCRHATKYRSGESGPRRGVPVPQGAGAAKAGILTAIRRSMTGARQVRSLHAMYVTDSSAVALSVAVSVTGRRSVTAPSG